MRLWSHLRRDRARDTKLGREVALKVLALDLSDDKSPCERFETKAKLLATLDHSNIGALYDFQENNSVSYLVMQLVEGET